MLQLVLLLTTLARADIYNEPGIGLPPPMDPSFDGEPYDYDPMPYEDPYNTPPPEAPSTGGPVSLPVDEVGKNEAAKPTAPAPVKTENAPVANTATPSTGGKMEEDLHPPRKDLIEEAIDQRKRRQERDTRILEVELAEHEGGNYHVGADYNYHPFDDYDFDPTGGQQGLTTNGANLQFMYFPVTHGYGRIGFGPNLGYYWTSKASGYAKLTPSFLTGGIEGQYQFLFGLGQALVPYGFGGIEMVQRGAYTKPTGATEPTDKQARSYAGGGLLINLNRLEHRTASRSLVDSGIKKYYLSLGYRVPFGYKNSKSGNGLLGLRFEF